MRLAGSHTTADLLAAIKGGGNFPSAMHRAAQHGRTESIKMLVELGGTTKGAGLVNLVSVCVCVVYLWCKRGSHRQ